MKPGQFYVNGVDSESLGTYIQSKPTIESPMRRIEWATGYGRDGSIPLTSDVYDNTTMSLLLGISSTKYKELPMDQRIAKIRREFYDLFKQRVWVEFIPYFDSQSKYFVMLEDKISIDNKSFMLQHMVASLTLTVLPYKQLVGYPQRTITSGTVLKNPTSDIARPLIKIVGNGNVTLTVGGRQFLIQGLSGYILLDCDLEMAYKTTNQAFNGTVSSNENQKIKTMEFPYLNVGNTTITWSGGTVTEVSIQERWQTII